MKFITVRELRNETSRVLRELGREKAVVTSNGKPVGLLLGVGDDLEVTLRTLERLEAVAAVSGLRQEAERSGASEISPEDIDREIAEARRP